MERIMKSQAYAKAKDPSTDFYAKMKKTFEVNPRHPGKGLKFIKNGLNFF
jgi:heat shock protein beta